MPLSRRGFLTACIATCTAPAIVRAASLMKLSVPLKVLSPAWYVRGGLPEGVFIQEYAHPSVLWPGIYREWEKVYGPLELINKES